MAPFFLETDRYEQMLFYTEKKETLQPEINPREEQEHGNMSACRLNQNFSCRTSKKEIVDIDIGKIKDTVTSTLTCLQSKDICILFQPDVRSYST